MAFPLGSAITAGAGIVSGIGSAISAGRQNKKARENALRMQQIGNEFSANEAQKARDFQRQMYEDSNEWNSPSAQRKRFQDAGFNPYLAMNGGASAGVAQGGSSSPAAAAGSAGSPPQVQSFAPAFSTIADSINSYFHNRKLVSETQGQDIENQLSSMFGSDMRKAQIASMLNGEYETITDAYRDTRQRYGSQMAQLGIDTKRQQLDNMRLSAQATKAQNTLVMLRADAQSTLNSFLNDQQRSDLYIKAAQLDDLRASRQLKDSQFRSELQRTILLNAEANGKRISNQIASSTADALIDALNMSNRLESKDSEHSMLFNYEDRMRRRSMERMAEDMLKFDNDITLSKGNRWIKRNLTKPFSGIGGPLGAAAMTLLFRGKSPTRVTGFGGR